MDKDAKEENLIQGDSCAHLDNQKLNTGVSPIHQIFCHGEIGDFVEVGYDLNDLGFLHENRLSMIMHNKLQLKCKV